jgi:radical SAM-linked protein
VNSEQPMNRQRVRIRFTKEADLRWLGHQDLARAIERLLRRACVKLAMTEGFHPRARISFPLALAVGIASVDEVLEFEPAEEVDPEELLERLARHTMPGLRIISVELLPPGEKKAEVETVELSMAIPEERQPALRERMTEFMAAERWPVEREGKRAPIDLRSYVEDLALEGGELRMRLAVAHEGTARPREVLTALGVEDLEQQGSSIMRTSVRLRGEPATRPSGVTN